MAPAPASALWTASLSSTTSPKCRPLSPGWPSKQRRARAKDVHPEQGGGLFRAPASAALQNLAIIALGACEMRGLFLPGEPKVSLKFKPQRHND